MEKVALQTALFVGDNIATRAPYILDRNRQVKLICLLVLLSLCQGVIPSLTEV